MNKWQKSVGVLIGLLALGAVSVNYAMNLLQGYNPTGLLKVPSIIAMNGQPQGIQNIVAFGGVASSQTATVTTTSGNPLLSIPGGTADFALVNSVGSPEQVAIPGAGATSTLLAPASLTISSQAETANGYANSGATSYTYSVCGAGNNNGLGPKVTTTNAALNSYLSPANANRLAWTAVTNAKIYDICSCTGAACTPKFLANARGIGYVDSGSLSTTGTCPCGAAATADTLYATIVTIPSSTTMSITPAPSQTVTATMSHDNLTPMQAAGNALAAASPPGGVVWIPAGVWEIAGLYDNPNYVSVEGSGAGPEYGTTASSSESTFQTGTTIQWNGPDDLPMMYDWNGLHQKIKDVVLDGRLGSWMTGVIIDSNATAGAGNDYGEMSNVGILGTHLGIRMGGTNLCGTGAPNCDISGWQWNNISLNDVGCNGNLNTCADTTAIGFLSGSVVAGPQSEIHKMSVIGGGKWLYAVDSEYSGLNYFTIDGLTDGASASGHEMVHWASGGALRMLNSADEPGATGGAFTFHVPANSLIGTSAIDLHTDGFNNKVSIDSPMLVFARNNACPTGTTLQVNYSSTSTISGAAVVYDEGQSSSNPACTWTYGASSGAILGQFAGIYGSADLHTVSLQLPEIDIKPPPSEFTAQGNVMKFVNPAASGKYNFCIGSQDNVSNGFEITASTALDGLTCTTPIVKFLQTGITVADMQFSRALVALGGGAAPTVGTIGGSGPAAAAQNSWLQVKDSAGNNMWIPVWK